MRVGDGEAALVVLLDAALDAVVGAGEHELDGAPAEARLGEHGAQRRARPVGGADASTSHGWLIGRGESRARPLPAHSMVTGRRPRRQRAQLVES